VSDGDRKDGYFVLKGGQHPWAGPFSLAQIEESMRRGEFDAADLCWSKDTGGWQSLERAFRPSDPQPPRRSPDSVPDFGFVLRRFVVGAAAIGLVFLGLCRLSTPPEPPVQPFADFDSDDEIEVPTDIKDVNEIENDTLPNALPDVDFSIDAEPTENSG
jgi:hypothetical protein